VECLGRVSTFPTDSAPHGQRGRGAPAFEAGSARPRSWCRGDAVERRPQASLKAVLGLSVEDAGLAS
jgi:hypothetical protein